MRNVPIHYYKVRVHAVNIFYRDSGPPDAPVILLMHGYPTSSFMFRNLIPILNQQYRVIAPDLPGFGFSDAPARNAYEYTFDNMAKTMEAFTEALNLQRFVIYIFDYGAPVGLRLAMANPQKIRAIITQNGNAYESGLSAGWNPVQKYWQDASRENRDNLRQFLTLKATYFQYHEGVSDQSLIAPETVEMDQHFLDRPENVEIQLDLLKDYANNIRLYPSFHNYFRKYQPGLLAVWGNKDPYFIPAGATAYTADLPGSVIRFYDTGHFALETHCYEIGEEILEFLSSLT